MTNSSFLISKHGSTLKFKTAFFGFCMVAALFICNAASAQSADNKAKSERHEFVRKGAHASEMRAGDFIIVTTAASADDAKKKSEQLKPIEGAKPGYGYLSEKKLWYVYLDSGTDNLDKTRALKDKVRQQEQYKDVWLLTVHN